MLSLKMPQGHMTDARAARKLFSLCWIAYVFTYLGRLNYAACLVEIVAEEGLSKASASFIATAFFLAYGFGQLVNGYIGDKLSPKLMVGRGLFFSGLLNILFPLTSASSLAAVLWGINGFMQSMDLVPHRTSALLLAPC